MKKVIAFHGSPGTKGDFKHIQKHLDGLEFLEGHIKGPGLKQSEGETCLILGYSWGAAKAIIYAANLNRKNLHITLVSPYLFAESCPSLVTTALLKTPLVSDALLTLAGKKKIEQLLVDSSYPDSVPSIYKADAKEYLRPRCLRTAALEKNEIPPSRIFKALKKLADLGANLQIIYGTEDKTSKRSKQLNPICDYIGFHLDIIENAGHALLWTHPELTAKKILKFIGVQKKEQAHTYGYHKEESPLNNVYSFLGEHVKTIPHKSALMWASREAIMSWKDNPQGRLEHQSAPVYQLDEMVGRLAQGMLEMGIKKGDRAIVFMPMSLYMYATMFALQKIGAIAVFLDSWARKDQMGVCAEISSPIAIFSFEQAFAYLTGIPEIDTIKYKIVAGPHQGQYSTSLEKLLQTEKKAEAAPVLGEHTALITFTTGSSGRPKGADRTHRFLCAQHYALNRHLPYNQEDVDLPVFPIFSLNNLAAGVTTVIPAIDVGVPAPTDAPILVAQFLACKVTCTTLSPSLLNSVSAFCLENNIKLNGIRRIITGGAPVGRDDLVKITKVCPQAEVLVLYGSTEVEPMAHIEAKEFINQKTRALTDNEWVDEGVNVGKMDEGLSLRFISITKSPIKIKSENDWASILVDTGDVGEIIVSGEHVCNNYYNDKDAFVRAKIKDENGRIWHRTGDLGRLDEDGNIWIVGRVHNAINRGGKYQFPVRAEMVLKKLPFVARAAYLGMPDSELGEATWCAVSLKEETDYEKVKSEIKRLMDKNNIPVDKIVIRNDIPMDARHHSKVEYDVLRKAILQDMVQEEMSAT